MVHVVHVNNIIIYDNDIMIYVNVDTPNLGFPYFNFLGGYQLEKTPCMIRNLWCISMGQLRLPRHW